MLCKCGCNLEVTHKNWTYYIGHRLKSLKDRKCKCKCGCGNSLGLTSINARKEYLNKEHYYNRNHRNDKIECQNLCLCGCGQAAGFYVSTSLDKYKKPKKFISGHNSRSHNPFKGRTHSLATKNKISHSLKNSPAFKLSVKDPKRRITCRNNALSLKGKTFEEIYGIEEAARKKENLRKKRVHQKMPVKATSIEKKLWKELKLRHIKFTKNKPILNITRPDAFIEPNICIYADGCYFHYCRCLRNKKNFNSPLGKAVMKVPKKDRRQNTILKKNGFLVYRLWEHTINSNKFTKFIGDFLYENTVE